MRSLLQVINLFLFFPLLSMVHCLIITNSLLYFVPITRIPIILYYCWILYDTSPDNGGWTPFSLRHSFRKLYIWKSICDYFPIQIIKKEDLDPKKGPYIFCYHPHGILSFGAMSSFGTEGTSFSKYFPGINVTLVSLRAVFLVPIFREWVLAHGVASADMKSITTILKKKSSVGLVVGGAQETMDAHEGLFRLKIKSRKGFIRAALKTGAAIVPVLGFGENALFSQANNKDHTSILRQFQEFLLKNLSFVPVTFWGRYGSPVPHPKPLYVVFGSPIYTLDDKNEKNLSETPAPEIVDKYHQLYLKELTDLYNKNKEKYGHDDVPLEFY